MLMKMPALPDSEQVAGALFVSIGLLRRRLRQQEVAGDLTFPETAALARLERCGPAVAADLARAEEISPQSMGVTLSGLQERGLIARSADPDDGRRVVLTITERGVEAMAERRQARVDQLAQAMDEFSADELAQLQAAAPLIERLAQRL